MNEKLQSEIERVRREQANSERDLRSQMDAMTTEARGGSEWKTRYETLSAQHREMESGFARQEKLAREVREETATYRDQLKALSERTAEASAREDRMVIQLQKLEGEVEEWKSRYTLAQSQPGLSQPTWAKPLRTADASSLTRFASPQGLIKTLHITQFQMGIDELLQSSRSEEPHSVLAKVKAVAISVRNISLDVGHTQGHEASPKISQVKARVSATMNNLITATRNFAISRGLSPVSLLDAAASHLTASVIELASIVKVNGAAAHDDGDDGYHTDIIDSPADYYGIGNDRASAAESTYSVESKPQLTSRTFSGSQPKKVVPNGVLNGVRKDVPPAGVVYDGKLEELKVSKIRQEQEFALG